MTPSTSPRSSETAPLLNPHAKLHVPIYGNANDSSITRFAAQAAVAGDAEGGADPVEDHGGKDGRMVGDERVKGWDLGVILFGLWLSNFAFAVQSSAIPTLAPRISASFSHSELASYLGSIFPLFSTAFTPVYGVLLDTVGRKWAMGIGAFFYTLGTLACGLSPTMSTLIAARAFAGIGGTGLLTVSSVITTDLIPLRERGYYQGLMMLVFGAGASLGGPVSGWIADTWGWPYAFYVQLPFVIISITVIALRLPATPPTDANAVPPTLRHAFSDFDFLGTALLLLSIASLMLGLTNHTAKLYAWSDSAVWGLLTAAAVGSALFLLVESRATNPVIPLWLFGDFKMASIYASNFMLSVAAQSFLYHIPVFFSVVLGTSSATAGLHLLPNSIGLAFGSLFAGQYIKYTGRYSTLSAVGLFLPVAGMYMASKWGPYTQSFEYWLEIFPAGLGYSVFLCCSLVNLISAVDAKTMPKATSVLYTVRSLGNTVGVAVSSCVQQGVLVHGLRQVLYGTPQADKLITDILHSKTALAKLPVDLQAQAEGAYAYSLSVTFLCASAAAIVTLLVSLPAGENDLGERRRKGTKKRDMDSPIDGHDQV